MKQKVLVLGAYGMAGHLISLYLDSRGYEVTAFARRPFSFCSHVVGDAFDKSVLERLILNDNYDIIINCIALLNQSAEDNHSAAVYLNSFLPHYLADITKGLKTKLICISTDALFAGNSGPYDENSICDSLSFYGRSKALGEVVDNKNLTFRTCIVGPDINSNGIGLFNWFMKQDKEVFGYTGAIWTGVTSLTLAKAIEQGIKENLTGLYTLVNNCSLSKFDLLCLFNHYFKKDAIKIIPNNSFQLDRSLHNNRTDFSFFIPSYDDQIREMYDWCICNKNIYEHYDL